MERRWKRGLLLARVLCYYARKEGHRGDGHYETGEESVSL